MYMFPPDPSPEGQTPSSCMIKNRLSAVWYIHTVKLKQRTGFNSQCSTFGAINTITQSLFSSLLRYFTSLKWTMIRRILTSLFCRLLIGHYANLMTKTPNWRHWLFPVSDAIRPEKEKMATLGFCRLLYMFTLHVVNKRTSRVLLH